MKNLSIRAKITIWFSALIIIIFAMMFSLMLVISNSVLNTDVKDTLTQVVDANVQEIEYFSDLENEELETGDHYVEYNGGYLEIDDDFLNESRGVYTALYDNNGVLLYGERISDVPVTDEEKVQKISVNKEKYYIYSRNLSEKNLEGLMLQGVVNKDANKTLLTRMVNLSLLILPLLALLAIIGGYILAGRFLSPIRQITNAAESIGDGNDLSKRIEIDGGRDELHSLADAFNKMFARLERSFEDEKQFTADISHELRTPIATVNAQCELIMEKEQTNEEYKKAIGVINRQNLRMKDLVEKMLRFSRLERMQTLSQTEQVDLSELVSSVGEETALLNYNGITLKSEIEDNIVINGSSELMIGLLNNLISNAYRYGKENGSILLKLYRSNDKIYLSVKDDGIGMTESQKEKIFNRFYQVDAARTAGNSGLGLGLSMVREIARLHNADITVDSEPGKGSTFTLIIPIDMQ